MEMLDINWICATSLLRDQCKKRSTETVKIHTYLILILPSLRPLTHIVDSVRQDIFVAVRKMKEEQREWKRARRMKRNQFDKEKQSGR